LPQNTAPHADLAPARIAVFDLDRTITRSGTYTPFLMHCTRDRPLRYLRVPLAIGAMGAYVAKRTSRKALKARMLALFVAGASRDQIKAWSEAFVERWLTVQVRPGAVEAIERHREAGDRIVMATASFDFYAKEFSRRLGIHETIATGSVWDRSERLCADVDGENCYGPAKVEAVDSYLARLPSRPKVIFYSDHHSDFELLKMADEGIAVNPNAKLHKLALEHGIQIADWG